MASNKIDARQSRLTSAQGMLGSSSGDTLDTIFPKINDEVAKLFEDRNVVLTDGGLITFLGTSVQFTGNLYLHLNSKVTGGSPVVIDLGSTTRNISASGRMIYAVIDRTAGTAAVTDDAATLPNVTAANQEVFLIAKRADSADGIKRLYFRQGMALNEGQSARLGASGSGSGSGSGLGDDLGTLTFKASFNENFAELTSDANTAVDYSSGKTDATIYNVVNQYLRVSYDATKTVTGSGTSMTLSGAPAFTIKAGDMLIVGAQAKRITAITSQTVFNIESAFTTDPLASACNVSQAIYTKDLNTYAGSGLAPSAAFSTPISQILVNYEDSTALGDVIYDANTAPVIAYSASSDGSSYSSVSVRPTLLDSQISMLDLPTSGTNLYLRFFSNATSGTGSANILKYKTFFHRDVAYLDGSQLNQSYGLTNGAGTEINISSIGTVSGKTRITKTWSHPVDVNSGTTNGALKVYLNGQKIPRFVDSTITPDASYKEIDERTIELDQDYSSIPLSVEIIQDVAVVDASDVNTTNIAQAQELIGQGFQGFVNTSQKINATTATGTPAPGTFHSTIVNRAPIADLSQDLKPRMGIERVMTQQIFQLQNEFGPNGEPVWGAVNDTVGMVRFVGSGWANSVDAAGVRPNSGSMNDFVEVTFYGTGLNVLTYQDNAAVRDYRASVDGGAEGSNFQIQGSVAISGRNYTANQIANVAAGLTLAVHTVKIRNAGATGNLNVLGFEILNQSSSVIVNPGSSYINGKKLTSSVQNVLPYNSSFESGTLGTRGGRVVVYQKADGSIAKAVQPVDAAQANLTSANHQNEEVSRTFHWREFGAGRADDFSGNFANGSNLAFTLDDGTTTLVGSAVSYSPTQSLYSNTTGSFYTFTFTGTGLDLLENDGNGTIDSHTILVDGVSIGSTSTLVNGYRKIVSGLPYGTHTVKILRNAAGNSAMAVKQFIVYQPKKPTIPSGAVELADYNVMADYIANGISGPDRIGSGVLRKHTIREVVYVGTWSATLSIASMGGWIVSSSTTNDYIQYTFFGSGLDLRFENTATTSTWQISLDGSTNLSGLTTSSYGAGISSFTASTGTLVTTTTPIVTNGISISNLVLGLHTIKITKTAGAGAVNWVGMDIITPIHSHKSNLWYDQQNTLLVGSNAISDNRVFSPVKDLGAQIKNVSQAVGVISSPTTTSTTLIPMPDMSVIHSNNTGRIKISYSANVGCSAVNGNVGLLAYVNGQSVVASQDYATSSTGNASTIISKTIIANVSPGVHKIDIYWTVDTGTATAIQNRRNLTVEEI